MCSKILNIQILRILVVFIIVSAFLSCFSQSVAASDQENLYLQNNIHAQTGARDTKASYANWTDPGVGHIIIPVNTLVKYEKYRRGFLLINMENGQKIYFEYSKKNMGMSREKYMNLIASPYKINLDKYSSIDQKGIKDGKAYIGMSKKGVRAALGYPAVHATSSLENNIWVYWRNRWKRIKVEFDNGGYVKNIQNY